MGGKSMQLDDAQRKKIGEWVAQGLKLSEIQNRLSSELGLKMTYMEVRMLVDDLKLVPKDIEPPKPAAPLSNLAAPPPATKPAEKPAAAPATGGVTVSVDQLAIPGAMVSGKVSFSDGQRMSWHIDQSGRLALSNPPQPGYRPPAADVQEFQMALETELSKLGF